MSLNAENNGSSLMYNVHTAHTKQTYPISFPESGRYKFEIGIH